MPCRNWAQRGRPMPTIDQIAARALRALIPPPRLRLSDWIEANIYLPEGVSAQLGRVRLWPFQREIADAIGDPEIERVTLVKPVRVGFTTLLTSAVGSFVANEPSPILCLLPAEADCRDYVVSDIEPVFAASPALAAALSDEQDESGRNTLLSRRFPGGSLKIVAAKAPRNLRRHNVRVLFMDEADGIIGAHDTGPLIRSGSGFWLAIPLPAAGKALGGKRITPGMWEQKTGLRLRFVYRSRGPSPLVADAVRLNTRGQAAVSKSKTGRGQVTAPIFLLVRQVKLPKRPDLARDADRAQAAIPGSIMRNWVEDHL